MPCWDCQWHTVIHEVDLIKQACISGKYSIKTCESTVFKIVLFSKLSQLTSRQEESYFLDIWASI